NPKETAMAKAMVKDNAATNEPSGMGMVGGAAAGAAAGSLMGPLGAAVGAVVGGAVGSQTHAEDVKKAAKKAKAFATSKPARQAMSTVGRKIAAIPAAARSLVRKGKKAAKAKPMRAK